MLSLKRTLIRVSMAVLIALPFGVLWQRQNIFDWWRLRDYQPPAEISALAERTAMTSHGQKLFYVYHPELNGRDSFNDHCRGDQHSIVLGCYVEGKGIYIFDVDDERLDGIKEVTAAHEMLHVAYERLSGKERERIDKLTDEAFDNLNNERIKKAIRAYRQRDRRIVPNELHSIIGTEVRNIPAELEEYYKKYFSNRLAVVELSERYESAFTERQDKVAEYDRQLEELKSQVEVLQLGLGDRLASINQERARLDALLSGNQIAEYNAGVPGFNNQVRQYNQTARQLQSMIDRYNELAQERNQLVFEERELVQAIDSRPQTLETQ